MISFIKKLFVSNIDNEVMKEEVLAKLFLTEKDKNDIEIRAFNEFYRQELNLYWSIEAFFEREFYGYGIVDSQLKIYQNGIKIIRDIIISEYNGDMGCGFIVYNSEYDKWRAERAELTAQINNCFDEALRKAQVAVSWSKQKKEKEREDEEKKIKELHKKILCCNLGFKGLYD